MEIRKLQPTTTNYKLQTINYKPETTNPQTPIFVFMPRNNIIKSSAQSLGYNFIEKEFLPAGKNEYYLRNKQLATRKKYRKLSTEEKEILIKNNNTSGNWNDVLVIDGFNPSLVKGCKFYGLVRIGKIEECCLSFNNLQVPAGLYNSTIISCDIGDNVVIDNVNYLSHYIIGDECMLININELSTTQVAKFGNGIVKKGEPENMRIWLELCNENAGRSVIPFNGMLPGDAFLWSKYRDDEALLKKFIAFTESAFNNDRGYYGMIGERTVIKNCISIKDVWIGTDAYIKGANKLKNLTIQSQPGSKTQIGEGCEIVNGIIEEGCRIFYGAKAVRFIMASHSQLKYGARLINSYLGNNATISCCEVLNSLIFPFHEQHHNNSFLCASLVMGQSNIAAGATIGSNHNSRGADGEIVAGRGFWPGLCVSLKHNSKFASYTMIAKGDYTYELNIPLPFSLVSNDVANDKLVIMPAYWFMYNMYALERNAWKYKDRDKRQVKEQHLEYNYLAPDTINEMFDATGWIKESIGKKYYQTFEPGKKYTVDDCMAKGNQLIIEGDNFLKTLELDADGIENSNRKIVIIKSTQAVTAYNDMIFFYGMEHLLSLAEKPAFKNIKSFLTSLKVKTKRSEWLNIGGQLIQENQVGSLKNKIKSGAIKSWQQVHNFYKKQEAAYQENKTSHAIASLEELKQKNIEEITKNEMAAMLEQFVSIKTKMVAGIEASRKKDYTNPFRKMVYDNDEEMDNVIGKFENNSFIKQQKTELALYKKRVNAVKKKFSL